MSDLRDKTILVTGSSRGLGRAIARRCARNGARLVLHYGQSHDAMQNLVKELGPAVAGIVSRDLSRPNAGADLWQEALEFTPKLDALVNNAGIAPPAVFDGDDQAWQASWRDTLAVNLQAPADLCRAAIASFGHNNGGSIVNITSRAAQRGDKMDYSAYAASKAGLTAFTQTLAKNYADQGIYAYCIAPGWIETEMAPTDPAIRNAAMTEIPLGRFAEPDEIAALAAFLLSGQCQSATGSTFDVNGSSHMR